MYKSKNVTALILAAGMGKRMGAGKNKVFLNIGKKSILFLTAEKFFNNEYVDSLIVAAAKNEIDEVGKIISGAANDKPFRVIEGGADRQGSSFSAVQAAPDGILLIHDGARPFVSNEIINNVIECTGQFGAAAPGVLVTDTVKKAPGGIIERTVSREELYLIQTPQGFLKKDILSAHEAAARDKAAVTDDCMLLERMGRPVKIVSGSGDNIKLTVKSDLDAADEIARRMKL